MVAMTERECLLEPVRVEKFDRREGGGLIACIKECFRHPLGEVVGENICVDEILVEGLTLVARDLSSGGMVGFCIAEEAKLPWSDDVFHLAMLGVLPAFSRRQLGKLLVDGALDLARERGFRAAYARSTGSYADRMFSDLGFARRLMGEGRPLFEIRFGPVMA